jgi:hypothetical protein
VLGGDLLGGSGSVTVGDEMAEVFEVTSVGEKWSEVFESCRQLTD